MVSLYCMAMDLPIIDGKSDHRKKLAEFQAESYAAASEILIGLSKQIAELGYEIVPVTVQKNGIMKGALALAPMNLEEYITFAKSLHAHKETETASDEKKGSGVSE